MSRFLRIMVGISMVLGLAISAGQAAAAPTPSPIPAPASALTPDQAKLAASPTPKTVLMDAKTGDVISITPETIQVQPSIVVNNPCRTGDACWTSGRVPYANFGFAGIGTVNRNDPYRSTMYTTNHSTSVCWFEAPKCSPRFAANTAIGFNGLVTARSVTNYT